LKHSQPVSGVQPVATLGERIRAIRTAWGWSQSQVCGLLHVDQASISFWERDRVIPSGSALVALAALFRCSVEALETGSGFVISDPPFQLPRTDHGDLRSVSLPMSDSGPVVIVDMVDGTAKGKDLPQAITDLAEALKVGRKTWVIIE